MQVLFKHIILLSLSIMVTIGLQATWAQSIFPVQSQVVAPAPHSPYLGDYASFNGLQVNILLREANRLSYSVRIKIIIENATRGIRIQTRESYAPEVILTGGVSELFTGVDLAPYFSLSNLEVQGLDLGDFQRTKRLPEGQYRISVQVLDFFRNCTVSDSNVGSTLLNIWTILPPIITLPIQNTIENAQNIEFKPVVFQWTRPANSPPGTEYEIILVELQDQNLSQSLNSSQGCLLLVREFIV